MPLLLEEQFEEGSDCLCRDQFNTWRPAIVLFKRGNENSQTEVFVHFINKDRRWDKYVLFPLLIFAIFPFFLRMRTNSSSTSSLAISNSYIYNFRWTTIDQLRVLRAGKRKGITCFFIHFSSFIYFDFPVSRKQSRFLSLTLTVYYNLALFIIVSESEESPFEEHRKRLRRHSEGTSFVNKTDKTETFIEKARLMPHEQHDKVFYFVLFLSNHGFKRFPRHSIR